MPSIDEIRRQIQEAESAKQQVVQYEQNQQAAEAARQQTKAEADKTLYELRQQEAAALWNQNIGRNAELVRANHAVIEAVQQQIIDIAGRLNTLLESVDVQELEATFREQQNHGYQSVAMIADAERERIAASQTIKSPEGVHMESGYRLADKHRSIQPALPLWAAIVELISREADPAKRRILQGVGFILTGQVYTPKEVVSRQEMETEIKRQIR